LLHVVPLVHAPAALQVWVVLPEHCVWPGAQEPVHAPPTQVWFEHAVAPPKVPFDWHVWTLLPVQVT
jgi:hypothetical protein